MNKEEILAKSRSENTDEGKKNAEDQGRQIGIIAFIIVLIFLFIFNMCTNRSNDALAAVFWTYVAAEAYPRYRFSKEKSLLFTTIAGGFLAIANLITYVMRVVG
ncbi:MAG TPA: hypothetical protein H9842_04785 [Candidatus Agathobaculum merdipullorum]|nr:DUF6442 family protein [uncultured Agathobaculum sp.]HIY12884.1 hypothetical protein [Candidatus Agathobaculum merdipullorum]